jgi:hypothetical protein
MAIEKENRKIDIAIQQKRRGYATPRRIRELRIGPGNEVGGWHVESNGAFASDPDADGFRIVLDSANGKISFDGGVFIHNTATPFSGSGGMTIEHGDGAVMLDVSGDGDGLGSQQVILRNADSSVYVGIRRNLSGTTRIIMGGLPTDNSDLSPGELWNDMGTLKIV